MHRESRVKFKYYKYSVYNVFTKSLKWITLKVRLVTLTVSCIYRNKQIKRTQVTAFQGIKKFSVVFVGKTPKNLLEYKSLHTKDIYK